MKSERVAVKENGPLRILAVGDVHAPFTHTKYADETVAFAKYFQPTHIVQVGDAYDQYCHSRFARSLNVLTPKEEDMSARHYMVAFWRRLQNASKNAKCYQLRGNHCARAYKRVLEKAPDLEEAVKEFYDRLYSYQGVKTLADDRSELVINNILFIHGYLSNLGDHAKQNRQPTVVGHTHRGGVLPIRLADETIWELNCGHIADPEALPLSYTQQKTTFWTPGAGYIEKLSNGLIIPSFVPF